MGQRGDLYRALNPLPTVYLLKKTNNEKCCSKPVELTDQSSQAVAAKSKEQNVWIN